MTVIAPTLGEGIDYVGDCLGISLINGASHIDMGTHNRRVRLGTDCYLEVIAIDADAQSPMTPRWFGLDQVDTVRSDWAEGRRLRGWVARTRDMENLLSAHGQYLGQKRWLENDFYFAVPEDGSLPMDGVLPSVIDMGDEPPTAAGLEDQGIRLLEFVLEHPEPSRVLALYSAMDVINPPKVRQGDSPAYFAQFDTPRGIRTLR
ncbi:VOC family protein [Coralliovum pocilloporae]|uniref:VOC family protein n=1 Tax=Coralliovum pocilloporae TaxID=3066369 RepID=UPI0033074076